MLFLLFAMLQLPLFSQKVVVDANAVLDKALAGLKSELPLRMDYYYEAYAAPGERLQSDKGVIYIDNDRYFRDSQRIISADY